MSTQNILPADGSPSRSSSKSPFANNPRRCAANESVCLKPTLPVPVATKKDSSDGATEQSDPTAEQWFQNANNNIQDGLNANISENEPPFYLKNTSSSSDSAGAFARRHPSHPANTQPNAKPKSLPSRAGLLRKHSSESSGEEYRSVIDDLTIENKRLRRKVRKLRRRTSSRLQGEKLFELTIHGLPGQKKRELEQLLKDFVSDIGETTEKENETSSGGQETLNPLSLRQVPSGSTSLSVPVDSGYGSNSINTSSGMSPSWSKHGSKNSNSVSQASRSQNQNIYSYLDEIPKGLLPRRQFHLSDKVKKEMVVRRLEQLFTGGGATGGDKAHTMQQEEISQSAASADRRAIRERHEKVGQEGIREARILPGASKFESAFRRRIPSSMEDSRESSLKSDRTYTETPSTSNRSPEQRPTRPLDLDPHRAQNAEDNMDYIRHLGLSSPKDSTDLKAEDSDGWVYLNLLMNMAQLHTINVTPSFVRESVSEYSTKFDISHDGRKIRWRGGHEGSKLDDEGSLSAGGPSTDSPDNGGSTGDSNGKSSSRVARISSADPSRSGSNTGSGSNSRHHPQLQTGHSSTDSSSAQPQQSQTQQSHLHYKPLFPQREKSSEDDSLVKTGTDSPLSSGGNEGVTSSGSRRITTSKGSGSGVRKRRDGPITFYSAAPFCTDLTGDTSPSLSQNPSQYQHFTERTIGCPSEPTPAQLISWNSNETRASLLSSAIIDEDMEDDDDDVDMEDAPSLHFAEMNAMEPSKGESHELVSLEASGLGGVRPEDNFVVTVRKQNNVTSNPAKSHHPALKYRGGEKLFPVQEKSLGVLDGEERLPGLQHASHFVGAAQVGRPAAPGDFNPPIKEEIVAAEKLQLPPAPLPPPSYIWLPFPSSDDDGSSSVDSDDEDSGDLMKRAGLVPPSSATRTKGLAALKDLDLLAAASRDDEDDEMSMSSDSSGDDYDKIRELSATEVAAREREFSGDGGARLDGELPAGSSAATAGGGSGYSTPNNLTSPLRRSSADIPGSLKRMRSD